MTNNLSFDHTYDNVLGHVVAKDAATDGLSAYCLLDNGRKTYAIPAIKKVICNPPATIILWEDGSKTVVKCCEADIYDSEKGFAMAVIKKLCGNDSATFHRLFKTWMPTCNEVRCYADNVVIGTVIKNLAQTIFQGGNHDGNKRL